MEHLIFILIIHVKFFSKNSYFIRIAMFKIKARQESLAAPSLAG